VVFGLASRLSAADRHTARAARLGHRQAPQPAHRHQPPRRLSLERDHLERHANGAPLAWIDDDFTASDHAWARTRNHTVPTLLIEPDPYLGLQPEHLEAIGVWSPVRRHVMKASA
jgi:hypothetical protein